MPRPRPYSGTSTLQIGEPLRYQAKHAAEAEAEYVDGLRNFYFLTASSAGPTALLERGISGLARVRIGDVLRPAAVLIRSSPAKHGSETAPWEDYFDVDRGYVLYYGDNKPGEAGHARPEHAPGNRTLLEQTGLHQAMDPAQRAHAAPLLFFRGEPYAGRTKGQVSFQGIGVIERAELVTQWDPITGRSFPNYRFHCAILSLSDEAEAFDWKWINARRDPRLVPAESLRLAPAAWQHFVAAGPSCLERVRRNVLRMRIVDDTEQRPDPGSADAKTVESIYGHFRTDGQNHRFEALAELVAEHVLRQSGAHYTRGWLTPRGSDRGIDFVGRLDVGHGLGMARIGVLGQAKCEDPDRPTNGVHLARTVARLRRGWIGAYVTTSYFSRPVQEEVVEDEYPLVLIHGRRVAESVRQMMAEQGASDVDRFLSKLSDDYGSRVQRRRASDILLT